MFKFLKDKLRKSISKITKRIDTEVPTEEVPKEDVKVKPKVEQKHVVKEEPKKSVEEKPIPEKKSFFSKIKESFTKKEEILEEEKEILEEEKKIEKEEKKVEEKVKPEAPVEKEVKKEVKEEVEKELEEERIEKEKELEKVEEEVKKPIPKKEVIVEKPKVEEKKEVIEPEEKKSFFDKIKQTITTKKINESQFEDIFYELELALLENNVALEVIEKIKDDLKKEIVDKPLPRSRIEDIIENTLKDSINDLFIENKFNIPDRVKDNPKRPFVICFVGINGSGKTTTIAKMANLLKNNNFSVVLSAADTFRAAAIQQLQYHGDKLNIKVIKHDYGSDPAAVAFDTIKYASAKNIDVVLIDTAGRMHSNSNLRDEMKKIIRVAKPDLKIFVGEAITGNDCVEQAKEFNNAIDIDGIILSKTDVDEKGGAAVSVSYVTKKPIIYIGTGQEYKDIQEFDDSIVMNSLGFA